MRVGLRRQGCGETFVDDFPVELRDRWRREVPHAGEFGTVGAEGDGGGDEASRIVGCDNAAVEAVLDQVGGRRAVVGDDAESAGERLGGDIAESLGEAGEKEEVGRGVVLGEIRAAPQSGKNVLGVARRQ